MHNMLVSALISASFLALGIAAAKHGAVFFLVAIVWFFIVGLIVSTFFDDDLDAPNNNASSGRADLDVPHIAESIRNCAEKRGVPVSTVLDEYRKLLEGTTDADCEEG